MIVRQATCCCGQLHLTCEGEPVRISICHCLACQRRTGSIFGVQARFARERVTISGYSTQFVRIGDEGGRATHYFCPVCGTTVYYEGEWMAGHVGVAVGAFADPAFPPPTVCVYESRRHPWASMPNLKAVSDD